MKKAMSQEQIIDHILNYDPEDVSTALKASSLQPALLSPRTLPVIPWPARAKPSPVPFGKKPTPDSALPQADVLVVTWTVAEALALSDVLTPGYRSKSDWYAYAHKWKSDFKPIVKKGAPSLAADRLGLWFQTKVSGKTVLCFKSELHMARDGAKLPVKKLWEQLIEEVNPSLVITTGTAGAVGEELVLGDVIVSPKVRFDCARTFKNADFHDLEFVSKKSVSLQNIAYANKNLLGVTTGRLPESKRPATIISKASAGHLIDVVTTDFFAYDDTTDQFGLQDKGSAVEMGDAVLGLVCQELGDKSPAWLAVRNASDPQIDGSLPPAQQVEMAGRIYEKYGYWTTVNSAIACWALIASGI